MRLLGQLLPVLISLAATVYRLPGWWRHRGDRALGAYLACLATFTLAWAVLFPPVAVTLAEVSGVANVSRPLGNGLTLVSGWCAAAYYVLQSGEASTLVRRKLRWSAAATVAAVVVMDVLFAAAGLEEEATATGFVARYATQGQVAAYRGVYLGWFAAEMLVVVWYASRYARASNRRRLTMGLWLITLGAAGALVYAVSDGAYVAARWLGWTPPVGQDGVRVGLLAVVALCMVGGSVLPALRGSRAGLARWVGQHRSYRRLAPLHATLTASLGPSAGGGRVAPWRPWRSPRTLDLGVHRLVVEINDALRQLQLHLEEGAGETARALAERAGVTGETLEATVTAARVAAVLQAPTGPAPHPPAPADITFAAPDPPTAAASDSSDVAAQSRREVARLIALADALGSCLVRCAVRPHPGPAPTPAGCGDHPR